MKEKSESEVAQSCPTLSNPMNCSLPGFSVHGFSRQECWSGVPLPSPTEEATHYISCSQECALYWRGEETSSLQASVKLDVIRSPLNFANSPSSIWCGKSLRTSKQICASRVQLLVLCRRQLRPILLAFLKTLTCVLTSHAGKVMLKILQARLQQYMNRELPDVQASFRRAEEQEIKLPTSAGSSKKQESSRKASISALLTMPKPLTVWITINCGKF